MAPSVAQLQPTVLTIENDTQGVKSVQKSKTEEVIKEKDKVCTFKTSSIASDNKLTHFNWYRAPHSRSTSLTSTETRNGLHLRSLVGTVAWI